MPLALAAAGAGASLVSGAPATLGVAAAGEPGAGEGGLWMVVTAVGVVAAFVVTIARRPRVRRAIADWALRFHLNMARGRSFFDNTPVQVLDEDLTAVAAALSRLRGQGVTSLGVYVQQHPELQRELQRSIRLSLANQPVVAACGCASRAELVARFPTLDLPPFQEVFGRQMELLWSGGRQFQEELRYLDAAGQERVCLVYCRAAGDKGRLDPSRVMLVLLDITTSKRTVVAQMENQELLRQILGRANILLWWAQVTREDGRFRWKISVPSQSFDSPIFKLATAIDQGGLWDVAHSPDLAEASRRADDALVAGKPGYQQTFRVIARDGVTHWLAEDVAISRIGENEWSFVGVARDITAQHDAEEDRRKSHAQLQNILSRADCMLWEARVTEQDGRFVWKFEAPASGLQARIFGTEGGLTRRGIAGDPEISLYAGMDVPDLAVMDACSTAAMRGGDPGYEQEFRVIRKGQTFWLHERVSITPVGPGCWNLVGMMVDVTAQKTAEEARRTSEARLHQLLGQADCMLWQAPVTREGEILRWGHFDIPDSALYKRLFPKGRDAGGYQMWNLMEAAPDLPEMDRRGRAALFGGEPSYSQEFRVVVGGETIWLEERVSITPVGRDAWNLVGVVMDVTVAREAESARRASEARLQQILDRSDCLLWQAQVVAQAPGDPLWTLFIPRSSLYRELFGEDPPKNPTLLWQNLHVPQLAEMHARSRAAIEGGAPGYEQEFTVVTPRATLWLHEQVTIAPVGKGQWSLIGLITNVTARREAEEARRRSQANLREILNRADCLLWHVNVERTGDDLRWVGFEMPSSVLSDRLFGGKPPTTGSGLWFAKDTPDLEAMNRRSRQAILSGEPGYEQEFSVIRPGGALRMHEQVSITSIGPDRWKLVGVLMDVTARREAEEARKKTEAQLQEILTRADCMLWQARVQETDGRLVWDFDVPDSGLKQRIFSGVALIEGRALYGLLTVPELPEMNVRCWGALHGGATSYEQEFRIVKPEQTYWLHERVSITPRGPGQWLLFGVLIDVSALKAAEQTLRLNEQRYRLMFDANPNPLLVFDRKTYRFLAVNDAAVKLYGYTREEFLALTAMDIRPPDGVAEFRQIMGQMSDGVTRVPLARHRAKDGRIIEVEATGTGVEFEGHQQANLTFIRDLTEERRARAALGESETRFRDLFENAVEGVYQADPQGHFLTVNPSLAQLFGCTGPEEFMTWSGAGSSSLYVKPGRRAEFFAELGARDSVTEFESEVRCRDGSTKWISENVRGFRDAQGELLHVQGFVSDITERRKALEAMRESEGRYHALFENMPVADPGIGPPGPGPPAADPARRRRPGPRRRTCRPIPRRCRRLGSTIRIAGVNEFGRPPVPCGIEGPAAARRPTGRRTGRRPGSCLVSSRASGREETTASARWA